MGKHPRHHNTMSGLGCICNSFIHLEFTYVHVLNKYPGVYGGILTITILVIGSVVLMKKYCSKKGTAAI